MSSPNERVADPVPSSEMERRWSLLRAAMEEQGVEATLAQGANNVNGVGGHARWISGSATYGSYPEAVIFPREGLMTRVGHGAFGSSADLKGRGGTAMRFGSPTFPAVNYCDAYDAEIVADQIRKSGFKTIGLVGQGAWYHGFASALFRLLDGIAFIDMTDIVDALRATKSPYEIELIRRAAEMQDAIFEKAPTFLQPGLTDYQAMANGHFLGALAGSATGYFLGGSAPSDGPAGMFPRPMQGRTVREGDVIVFQPENSGPGGYFVHACRIFVMGKPSQELVDRWGDMVEAQDYTVSLLQNGASSAEIFAQYNAWMERRGFPKENRLYAHSQGYDVVERPLIRQDETMPIGPNMNIGIHPRYESETAFVTVCDNFLTHEDGNTERLHKTPREIFEL